MRVFFSGTNSSQYLHSDFLVAIYVVLRQDELVPG